ncbi:MAG TPA: 23S rRNA (adenine(2503)-C(2))-methyltransferase RlmN [Trueperaceae bacterium]
MIGSDPTSSERRGEAAGRERQLLLDLAPSKLPTPGEREAYRRTQLAGWIYRQGVRDFEEMSNLPAAWRAELAERWLVDPFAATERFPSRDGSVRYLFTLSDGRQTEAVYMPYLNRRTVCVSSMVGCPAGCAFCATGALGFGRNLSAGEIVGQLLAVAWHEGFPPREIRNVVLMGMGEALLNYDSAITAVRTMVDPEALDMSPRRITLSTVGLPAKIVRLAEEGLPLTLAVSLHAPDEETRRKIIPTAHAHSIASIVEAMRTWQQKIGRRVTIEYTMLRGVNDRPWQAKALAELLTGLTAHVNLIPFNPWSGAQFGSSGRETIDRFQAELEEAGLSVSVRFSRGRDAGGACGQLALTNGRSDSRTTV